MSLAGDWQITAQGRGPPSFPGLPWAQGRGIKSPRPVPPSTPPLPKGKRDLPSPSSPGPAQAPLQHILVIPDSPSPPLSFSLSHTHSLSSSSPSSFVPGLRERGKGWPKRRCGDPLGAMGGQLHASPRP